MDMNKKNGGKIFKKILLFGILSFVFLNLFSPYTSILNKYYGIDTAQYWVIGKGILQGKMPYVDLFDHKGPIIFLVWALGCFLGNGTKCGILFLQTVSLTVCLVYMDKLVELFRVGAKKKIIVFLMFFYIFCGTIVEGGLTEEWALPCSIYVIYIACLYIRAQLRIPVWKYAFIMGSMFAYVGGMRVNNAVCIGITVLFLGCLLLLQHKYKEFIQSVFTFLCGIIVIITPIAIWFLWQKGWDEMIYGSLTYNYVYAVEGLSKSAEEWIKVFLYEGISFLFLIISYIKETKDKCLSGADRTEYGFIAVNLIVTGLSCILGYTWQHYFMLYLPCIILVICRIFRNVDIKKYILIAITIVIPFTWQTARNVGKNLLFDVFGYYDATQQEIAKVSNIIPEEDKEYVWGIEWCSSKWFAINDITPCYKVFDFPAVLSRSGKLYEDTRQMMQKNPPRWILEQPDTDEYIEGYSEWLAENYDLIEVLSYDSQEMININQAVNIELWHIKAEK